MKVRLRLWLGIDFMTCIGTAHSNEQVIFWCDVPNNIPLAFAAVLPTDKHINQRRGGARVKT